MPEKRLEESPFVDETAVVTDSELGRWTEVGAGSVIIETVFGDYSYAVNDAQILYTRVRKFAP